MKFLQNIKIKAADYYYTKRHGLSMEEYQYQQEMLKKINPRAYSLRAYYHGFKHIIQVDYNKFKRCPFLDCPSLSQYNILRQHNAVYGIHRVWKDFSGELIFNDIGGHDHCFIACDDDESAVYFTLMYG